jgi:hypothetical protein
MNTTPRSVFLRFNEMPRFLRFVLFPYSLIGGMVFIYGSIIPVVKFEIEGRPVSRSQWWASGAGPFFAVIGLLLCISAMGFYRRKSFARLTFFAAIAVALLFMWAFEVPTLKGMLIIGALSLILGWYFFLKKSVRHYFTADKKQGKALSRIQG